MHLSASLLALLPLAASATPLPLSPRGTIPSSSIVGFPQTVPAGSLGQLYLRFQPRLYVQNGCVPFPAVDAAGDTNAGLKPTGSPSGGCSSSRGQVYARAGTDKGRFGILYAWYMPKDEPSSGIGHRHDWEGCVVWLGPGNASVTGVSASAHGGYAFNSAPNMNGDSPLIKYASQWPLDHSMGYTSTVGGTQPLVAWESLTDAARAALTTTDFGKANVQFNDANFQANLQKANG